MAPAVALAYEKAESDIMNLPPRNPKTDKLVNAQLLLRAYLMIGAIESAAGFCAYFIALGYEGFKPNMLWQLRTEWEDKNSTVLRYGLNDDWSAPPSRTTVLNTL
jgi:magnesium-transporting ATPase (P-type)